MESEASLRGYTNPKRARSMRARRAGLASGRKRRRLAPSFESRRARQRELALNFPVRLVDRREFERRDDVRRAALGIGPSERGTETLWQEYLSCVKAYKAQGQGFLTTNGQRAAALRKRGRPRCERTVRRAHASLTEMGLLRRFHDRRGGSRAGNRDRLRVELVPSFVPPPLAAGSTSASRSSDPAPPVGRTALSAPPDGGRGGPPVKPAEYGSNGGEQLGLEVERTPEELAELAEWRARALG